ncbi:hypothetical protein V511_09600 [Mesotoga sp. Brook.08.YT.4.2.5.1]|nr:hypothetical protein V511_09600 [Mesotoga sp. Brook.08.YT.4.2.5.1]
MQRAVLRPSSRSINPSFGRAGRGERKRGREDAKNGTDVRSSSVPILASRLFVSEANGSTVLFLDGLISERVHDLQRSTANHV